MGEGHKEGRVTVGVAVFIHFLFVIIGVSLVKIGFDMASNKDNDKQVRIWGALCIAANAISIFVNAVFIFAAILL